VDILVNCVNCYFGLVLFVTVVLIVCIINQLFELSVWGRIIGNCWFKFFELLEYLVLII
jgi:hypothetical protein